jgi:hypothetical protein
MSNPDMPINGRRGLQSELFWLNFCLPLLFFLGHGIIVFLLGIALAKVWHFPLETVQDVELRDSLFRVTDFLSKLLLLLSCDSLHAADR